MLVLDIDHSLQYYRLRCDTNTEFTLTVKKQDVSRLVTIPNDQIRVNIELLINNKPFPVEIAQQVTNKFQYIFKFSNYKVDRNCNGFIARCQYMAERNRLQKKTPLVATKMSTIEMELFINTECQQIEYETIISKTNLLYTAYFIDGMLQYPFIFCPIARAKMGSLFTQPTVPRIEIESERQTNLSVAPARFKHRQPFKTKRCATFASLQTKITADIVARERQRYFNFLKSFEVSKEAREEYSLEPKKLYERYQRHYSLARYAKNPTGYLKKCRKCGLTPNFLAFELPGVACVSNCVFDK
ncbi:hypothetical protein KGF57_004640 [Candida theae]|uniref:Uncharacterized protein n=1 Tax=Candida theae TaxID=1198502 RepID=A0AAD5BAX7_9ASCO|nr:uncharacterized protein KGF57_004640 [Candida theae]KAI5949817.1 hypothetical protein KGF57_004640 [Candida theae]